jgi:hypothetical protein
MAFHLRPTVTTLAAGATAADYTATLPDGPLNLSGEKQISVAKTIDGSAAVSVWQKKLDGTQTGYQCLVDDATHTTLRRMDMASYTDWILTAQGRTFSVAFDIASALPERLYGKQYWRCQLNFTILQELHR